MLNIAQLFGDYVLLLGMVILLVKVLLTKNCAGISGKTQLLYALIFTTRYLDLAFGYVNIYNTILRIIYIVISYATVLSVYVFHKRTYNRQYDAFRIELLILPSAAAALVLSPTFGAIQVFQTFGIFLQSVAIVPQVYFVSKCKQVEAVVISYISCLGLHLGFYLTHWFYAYAKQAEIDRISVSGGLVQLIFYCDFFARNLPILKSKFNSEPSSVDLPYYARGNISAAELRELGGNNAPRIGNHHGSGLNRKDAGVKKDNAAVEIAAEKKVAEKSSGADKNQDEKVAGGKLLSR